jgi:hypothetical protein
MAKCFITGVELNISNGYVLDIAAAQRALRNMRLRVASLERLIQQLSPRDNAEVYDVQQHKYVTKTFRRVVSAQVGAALAVACPEETIFLPWQEWSTRRRAILTQFHNAKKTVMVKRGPDIDGVGGDPVASIVEKQEECHANDT